MKIEIFKRIVLLLGGMFLLCGCEKEELIRFDNTNTSVSFRTKETIYSFMTKPDAEKDTVKVVVNVMGMPVAYDRSFAVEVLPEKTTADSKNYKILKAEVKAMELEGVLWVEIHNQESLRETVDSLHLRIVDSKDFQVGDINASTNLITWTAKIVPPITWRVMAFWFCTIYSEEVYQRIIEFTGLVEINATYSYLNTSLDQKLYPKMSNSQAIAYQSLFRQKVKEYNAQHPDKPLRHGADAVTFTYAGTVNITGILARYPNELIVPR